jgi:hypothetical protein
MSVAVQARGFREAETMGVRTGKEEHKTTTLGMGSSFRIFGVSYQRAND